MLAVHRLDDTGYYQLRIPEENERYWIPEMSLFIGVWSGTIENITGFLVKVVELKRGVVAAGFGVSPTGTTTSGTSGSTTTSRRN